MQGAVNIKVYTLAVNMLTGGYGFSLTGQEVSVVEDPLVCATSEELEFAVIE